MQNKKKEYFTILYSLKGYILFAYTFLFTPWQSKEICLCLCRYIFFSKIWRFFFLYKDFDYLCTNAIQTTNILLSSNINLIFLETIFEYWKICILQNSTAKNAISLRCDCSPSHTNYVGTARQSTVSSNYQAVLTKYVPCFMWKQYSIAHCRLPTTTVGSRSEIAP